jgi:hypothetical protein
MRVARYVLLALVVGCTPSTAPALVGAWGGTQASLTLERSGGALTYPCGTGTIDSTWTLSESGAFAASGQHFFGGGPDPVQGRPPHPARYTGQVSGNLLTLTVTLLDLNETLGPFTLVRGGPPVQEMCV